MKRCPHCDRPMTDKLPIALVDQMDAINMQRMERLVLDCLMTRYPRTVSRQKIEEWLFDETGERIDYKPNTVRVYISKLRKHLKPYGIGVKCNKLIGWKLTC